MPDDVPLPARPFSTIRAYAELVRLPNVFTALADVGMGFLFVRGAIVGEEVGLVALLAGASAMLYSAGMVLNDAFDFEVDARDRPRRPLPSGRISRAAAWRLGLGLLAAGVILGCAAAGISRQWLPGLIAAGLAACIVLYDGSVKKTPAGPPLMGACRTLNVLLGMSVAAAWAGDQWLVAGGIGIYVTGITWFARCEARQSRRGALGLATMVMLGGIGLLATLPRWSERLMPAVAQGPGRWALLMGVLGLVIAQRMARAIVQPVPERVQTAVKTGILSLIVLDASVTLAVAGPVWAVAVLALLAPALVLGEWVYST